MKELHEETSESDGMLLRGRGQFGRALVGSRHHPPCSGFPPLCSVPYRHAASRLRPVRIERFAAAVGGGDAPCVLSPPMAYCQRAPRFSLANRCAGLKPAGP